LLPSPKIEIKQCEELRGIRDGGRGDEAEHARRILTSLVEPLVSSQDHVEILVVTHRRFLANIFQDGK
jgi:hypothetical protein